MAPAPHVETTDDPPSNVTMTVDPAAVRRGSWVSNLTIGQLGGVGSLLLLLSGGGGMGFSALVFGGDLVHQDELEAMEVRLRADLQKDRQIEMLAQEQRLAAELADIDTKLAIIGRELGLSLE
tara:strand:+ start:92 stop:460 length:369 start_codon:yes stop_codon:yes gene_type:complete